MSYLVGLAMVHYLLTCGVGYVESRSVGAQAALGTHTQANYHNYVAIHYTHCTCCSIRSIDMFSPIESQQCPTIQRRGHWVRCNYATVVDHLAPRPLGQMWTV